MTVYFKHAFQKKYTFKNHITFVKTQCKMEHNLISYWTNIQLDNISYHLASYYTVKTMVSGATGTPLACYEFYMLYLEYQSLFTRYLLQYFYLL